MILAALALGCRGPASVEVDPALAYLVTSDTIALIGVNLDDLRATPLFRRWLATRIESLGKEGGVDFNKDVVELLAVSNGKEVIVYAKGKSSVLRLNSKIPPPLSKGAIPAALRQKIRSIPAGNQIWGAGIGSDPRLAAAIPESGNLANLRNMVASIQGWTLGIDLRSGLKVEANGVYATGADAKPIHDALRGLVGLGRLSTPTNAPELLRFYDGIKISQQNTGVRISANIPPLDVNAFLEKWTAP